VTVKRRVSFAVGNVELAEINIDGPVLLAPAGTTVARDGETIVIQPADGTGLQDPSAPDVFVGSLPVLYMSSSLRRPAVASLDVPPPAPFAGEDIQQMWRELRESPMPVPDSVSLQGRVKVGGKASFDATQLELAHVARAIGRGLALSRDWPQLETTETLWRPTDLRGGREDGRLTERHERQVAFSRSATPRIPDRTARRRASSEDWRSSRVAAVTRALRRSIAHRAGEGPGRDALRQTERLLDHIARSVTSPIAARDIGPSSWPSRMRAYYADALRAFSALEATRAGIHEVPLSRLWELYEAWVTTRCFRLLCDLFGEPVPTRAPILGVARWSAEWSAGERRVHMFVQPVIGAQRLELTASGSVQSISSTLIPDVLLAIQSGANAPKIFAIDAKKRGAGTAMRAGDVAEAASKYLWGIVWAGSDSLRAIEGALIAASALENATMYSTSAAIEAHVLLPSEFSSFEETVCGFVELTEA
jgi:hypothetical protein